MAEITLTQQELDEIKDVVRYRENTTLRLKIIEQGQVEIGIKQDALNKLRGIVKYHSLAIALLIPTVIGIFYMIARLKN